jgi:hypothetical protein
LRDSKQGNETATAISVVFLINFLLLRASIFNVGELEPVENENSGSRSHSECESFV